MNIMEELIASAWSIYRVLNNGPASLKAAGNDILALLSSLGLVADQLRAYEPSRVENRSLRERQNGCDLLLEELENALARSRLSTGVPEDIAGLRSQIVEETNQITSFLETLQRSSQARILEVLNEIRDDKPEELRQTLGTNWIVLEAEMIRLGLEKRSIDAEFFFIRNWLRDNCSTSNDEVENEDPPDYAPGAHRGTIEEKVQELEQTSLILTQSSTEIAATLYTADPPPYTFEEGSDEFSDSQFSQYIQNAIRQEASHRFTSALANPPVGPRPWDWLPLALRPQYKDLDNVNKTMDSQSFSVMAYETMPRCAAEIERLKHLMKNSFDRKQRGGEEVNSEAFKSLEIMSAAISCFALLQDQNPQNVQYFSDLDILDYEYSTAIVIDPHIEFPHKEFELIRKSCYQLLTYVMGFLNALSSIYVGRTYVSRSDEELDLEWKSLRLSTRVAWVEKQLAEWTTVENTIAHCRQIHRMQPYIRSAALKALDGWKTAERVLVGDEVDNIKLIVLSATGLPNMKRTWVKIVYYGPNNHGGARRMFEGRTAVAQRSVNPFWRAPFDISAECNSKMIHLEVYEEGGIMDKEIGRVKLFFSSIRGMEASFVDRSLLYDYDEEIDLPLVIAGGKGKETAQPTIKVALCWKGRRTRVQERGLPSNPPGKMFRQELISTLPIEHYDKPISIRSSTKSER